MNYCDCCGSPIPDGQSLCSMCYGDISYGRDGCYEQWAREQEQRQREQEEAEQAHLEKMEAEKVGIDKVEEQ